MKTYISDRIKRVKPSVTLAVTSKARELRAAGKDVIGLGAGEPDFDTPEHICTAGAAAIRDGKTRYTAVDGIPELKAAIRDKFQRDNGLAYADDQIIVSTGAKQSLFNLCMAVLNPGDEAIVPSPYWVSYPEMARLADAEPVFVHAGKEQHFKITPQQLDAAITDRTRLLFINSPSNPTGIAYTRAELAELGQVLEQHARVLVVTDDMYEHIYWGAEPFCSFASACPSLAERTIVVHGVSKAYAMTGWRIGYAAGPAEIVKAMKKLQGQSTSNPSSISQYAAVAALDGDQRCVTEMNKAFRERHDYVVPALNEIAGVSCTEGDGTFYAFPDVRDAIAGIAGVNDDLELTEHLLDTAGVALVPGSAFGAPGHIRLSFATSLEVLKDAIGRLAKALD